MMKNFDNKNRGISILGILVLGFLLILTLSYFNISIKGVVQGPAGQENIGYVKGATKSLWTRYLAEPAHYLWKDVWVDIFWKTFIQDMKNIRDGLPTTIDKATPRVNFGS